MDIFFIQLLNGLVFSMLLFVLAAGLSLIFGQMNVINLAHGAFYLLGGYIGLSIVRLLDNFWLALLLAPLLVGGLGLVIEHLFLRRLYGRQQQLGQVLFTFGLALIAADLMRWHWGAHVEAISPPP
jgi:branched-chain amino acid transport system permease protein